MWEWVLGSASSSMRFIMSRTLTDSMLRPVSFAVVATMSMRKAFTMSVQWLKTLKKLQHLPSCLPGMSPLKQSWESVRTLFRNRFMRTVRT